MDLYIDNRLQYHVINVKKLSNNQIFANLILI